jgi:hypothetical protein
MRRGRWLRWLLPAGLVLGWAVVGAGPAGAAPCTVNCTRYTYQADITLAASGTPAPVVPGGLHYVTVQVTNTGWRTGGNTMPMPSVVGPDSGEVYVGVWPRSPDEVVVASYPGPGFSCASYVLNSMICNTMNLPTNTTGQFTLVYRAPPTPGTYTYYIWANTPYPFTEYDELNNNLVLTYRVGYPA